MADTVMPFLWFDDQALEAAQYYVAGIKNSKLTEILRMNHGLTGEQDKVLVVSFTLDGRDYAAMNGGPHVAFNDSVSMMLTCEDQAEVDRLWAYLSAGGKEVQCGWLQDKWGLRWQVVPKRFFELMASPEKAIRDRVFAAVMKMVKFDVAALEAAARG